MGVRVLQRLMLAALPLGMAMACGPAVTEPRRPAAAPAVSPAPPADVEPPPLSILWATLRPLRWADFQGQPDATSDAAAITAYVISFEAECSLGLLNFRVVSAFLPERSWVKTSLLLDREQSPRALQHEQTHFDLSEVHVRRARQLLSELTNPCARLDTDFGVLVEPILRADREAQDRYDRESRHGMEPNEQARWDDFVRRELASLRQFAR